MCAILIMLYHYTTRYFDIYFDKSYESDHIGIWWGCFAVSVFFMLSGFLTDYTYNDKVKAGEFIKKRLIRLYPAYIFAIIVTTVFTLIFAADKFIGIVPTFANLTVFQSFLGMKSVDGAYWTLSVELIFYIIFSFLILFGLVKWNDIMCFIWMAIIVIYSILDVCFKIPHIVSVVMNSIVLSNYAHMFIAGISLCRILNLTNREKQILNYMNLCVCLIYHFYKYSIQSGLFVFIFVILMVMSVKTNISCRYFKPVVFVAKISYPLYLIHQNVGYIIIYAFTNIVNSYVLGVLTAISVSIFLAFLIHEYLEKPIVNLIKNKI